VLGEGAAIDRLIQINALAGVAIIIALSFGELCHTNSESPELQCNKVQAG